MSIVWPFEWLRLPVGRDIGHHPVANSWIPHVERAALGGESRLCPIHPQPEFHSVRMRGVGERSEPMRKFVPIGIPVAYATEPSGIHVEHLEAEVGGVGDHFRAVSP